MLKVDGKTIRYSAFNNLSRAQSFAYCGGVSRWIVLGDFGQYWVVRPVDAARLERAGYSIL
jgi:hypothetical protein